MSSATAWSAHSLPKFPLWSCTFCMVSRSLWTLIKDFLTRECQLRMCASVDRAQTDHNSMHRIVINTRLPITGDWTTRIKKRQCFNRGCLFNSVVGLCSRTRESKMSLGGNDGTKHDIHSPMVVSGNPTHPAKISPSTT